MAAGAPPHDSFGCVPPAPPPSLSLPAELLPGGLEARGACGGAARVHPVRYRSLGRRNGGLLEHPIGYFFYVLLLSGAGIHKAAVGRSKRLQCAIWLWSVATVVFSLSSAGLVAWTAYHFSQEDGMAMPATAAWNLGEESGTATTTTTTATAAPVAPYVRDASAFLLGLHAASRAARTAALVCMQRQDWRRSIGREGEEDLYLAYRKLGQLPWMQRAVWMLPLLGLVAIASISLQGDSYWRGFCPFRVERFGKGFCPAKDGDRWPAVLEALGTLPFVFSCIVIFGAATGACFHVSCVAEDAVGGLTLQDERRCARLGQCWTSLTVQLRDHCPASKVPVVLCLSALLMAAASTGLDLWIHSRGSWGYLQACDCLYCFLWSSLLLSIVKALVDVNLESRCKIVYELQKRLGTLPDAEREDARGGAEKVQAALMLMASHPLGWFIQADVVMTPAMFKVVAGGILTNVGAKLVAFLTQLRH